MFHLNFNIHTEISHSDMDTMYVSVHNYVLVASYSSGINKSKWKNKIKGD